MRALTGIVLAGACWVLPAVARAQTPTAPDNEPALLAALREAEREADRPRGAGTVAQAALQTGAALDADGMDPDFAGRLQLTALQARMTPRLVRALGLFRTDVRARRMLAGALRHASRYRARMEVLLAAEGVPPDLVWVAAIESGFDPRSDSSAGAGGAWQLMPEAARTYCLRVDAWVDERRDPDRSTRAAARYLRDLHARFGTWELALAAYNMGYNALLRAIRKYNTNDFEALAAQEAGLPWETVHYVPRILATALAAHNEVAFALGPIARDPVVAWEDVEVRAAVFLADVARGANVDEARLRALNPGLLRARTPAPGPDGAPFTLHVPVGARDAVVAALARTPAAPTRLYALRYGETVDEVAARYGLRGAALLALSGLPDDPHPDPRPGMQLLTPDRDPVQAPAAALPVVAVDTAVPPPEGRHRVFLRVPFADDLGGAARALGVTRDELAGWNALDPGARLQPGMWLQAFVASDPVATARVWQEAEVSVVGRGSEIFHDHAVAATGLVRIRVTVAAGDTMASLADRYGSTVGRLARINHRDRHAALTPGEVLLVYTDPSHAGLDDPLAPLAPGDPPAADEHR